VFGSRRGAATRLGTLLAMFSDDELMALLEVSEKESREFK